MTRHGLLALGCAVVVASSMVAGCADDPSPLVDSVRVRGHRDMAVSADGTTMPRITGEPRPVGLCFDVDSRIDTTAWETTLAFGDVELPATVTVRSAGVHCVLAEPPEDWSGRSRLCGHIRDPVDQRASELPCADVEVDADPSAYATWRDRRAEVLASDLDLDELVDALDALSREATSAGYPAFGLQLRLIGAHFLAVDGSESARDRAMTRLDDEPAWFRSPNAAAFSGLQAQQRALVQVDAGRLSAAWEDLSLSEQRYSVLAIPQLVPVKEGALLLAEVGAISEARQRLSRALADCEEQSQAFGRSVCAAGLTSAAQGDLAWLTLLDTTASPADLDTASDLLAAALDHADADDDPLEAANRAVDLAFARSRRGGDTAPELARARALLDTAPDGRRRQFLEGWSAVVGGLAALEAGDATGAEAACRSDAIRREPRLRPWASSCIGRAYRLRGALDDAARAFDDALLRHELDRRATVGERVPLGVDQRADDFARAARLAVERGDVSSALDILRRLDRLTEAESDRRSCRAEAGQARRIEQEAELTALLAELDALDGPASAARHAERRGSMRDLAERVRRVWRSWDGCSADGRVAGRTTPIVSGVTVRAVALPDEVLILTGVGNLWSAERWPVDRRELRELLDAFAEGRWDADAWRHESAELAARLTAGLRQAWPDLQPPTEVSFVLHGLLQDLPLVALPWDGGWLGEAIAPAVRPAGATSLDDGAGEPTGEPLIVVDPTLDLPAASRTLDVWRQDFPTARLLRGVDASRDAVVAGLGAASWLHVDAHGTYDPAFPELSGLLLADRPLRFVELADATTIGRSLRFVNLSGCQTGRWPITADSGTYGLAGLFSRAGVPWVVASRNDLPDRLAADFNRAFYAALASGETPAVAFRRGVARVAEDAPPHAWGGLLLLRAAPVARQIAASPGQSAGTSTPSKRARPIDRSPNAEETTG